MKLGPKVGVPKPGVGGCTPVWRATWFVADPKTREGGGNRGTTCLVRDPPEEGGKLSLIHI